MAVVLPNSYEQSYEEHQFLLYLLAVVILEFVCGGGLSDNSLDNDRVAIEIRPVGVLHDNVQANLNHRRRLPSSDKSLNK